MKFLMAALAVIVPLAPAFAGFKEDVAAILKTEPAYLSVNQPPRPAAFPGAVYSSKMRFLLRAGDPADSLRGAEFDLQGASEAQVSAGAAASFASIFGAAANASASAKLTLFFERAHIYEMTLEGLRKRLRAMPPNSPYQPLVVIYKSYVGVPSLRVSRDAKADAKAWAETKTRLGAAGIAAAGATNDDFIIRGNEEAVFAFEAVEADSVREAADQLRQGSRPIQAETTGQHMGERPGATTSNATEVRPGEKSADPTSGIVVLGNVTVSEAARIAGGLRTLGLRSVPASELAPQ